MYQYIMETIGGFKMKEGMMIKGVVQEVNDAGYGILYSNRERIQVKRVLVDEEVKVKIVKILSFSKIIDFILK